MTTTTFTAYETIIAADWLNDVDAVVYDVFAGPTVLATTLYVDTNSNFVVNKSGSSRATNATNGFAYLPDCAGTPTGTPAATYTGASPVIIDKTNYLMYFYLNGAWRTVGRTYTAADLLPAYESGKYLTNNGSTLSWGTVSTTSYQWLMFGASDQTATISTGTAKITFRLPACVIYDVRASLQTASSSGTPTFDINDDGSTILSTKLTIDANEKTSTTAAAAYAFQSGGATQTIDDDSEMTIDIDTAGTGAKGWAVYLKVAWS